VNKGLTILGLITLILVMLSYTALSDDYFDDGSINTTYIYTYNSSDGVVREDGNLLLLTTDADGAGGTDAGFASIILNNSDEYSVMNKDITFNLSVRHSGTGTARICLFNTTSTVTDPELKIINLSYNVTNALYKFTKSGDNLYIYANNTDLINTIDTSVISGNFDIGALVSNNNDQVNMSFGYILNSPPSQLTYPATGYERYLTTTNLTFEYYINHYSDLNIDNTTFYLYQDDVLIANNFTNIVADVDTLNTTYNYTSALDGDYVWYMNYCLNDSNCYNITPANFSINTTKLVTFSAIDYAGDFIEKILYYASGPFGIISHSGSNYGNYSTFISRFLNDSRETSSLNMSFTDRDYRNIANSTLFTIRGNTSNYNITLNPVKLSLYFYQNGTANEFNTSGQICEESIVGDINTLFDNYGCKQFNTTPYVQIQQSLSIGNVFVKFNLNESSDEDWLQYYEYYNNRSTNINEKIEIIEKGDVLIYFKVTDAQNRPIEDATIRVGHYDPDLAYNYSMIGRRLTKSGGTTSFYFDSDSTIRLLVTADGYTPKPFTFYPADQNEPHNTLPTALRISLAKSTGVSNIGAWINAPRRFHDRSQDITISMVAPDWSDIQFLTSYGNSVGLDKEDPIETGIFSNTEYYFTLESGIDFSATGTDDITLMMYYDTINTENITIEFFEKSDLFDFSTSSITEDYMTLIWGIVLIILSSLVGFWLASPTAGVTVFIFGGIVLALVDSSFIWLGIVNAFLLVLYGIKKVFRE